MKKIICLSIALTFALCACSVPPSQSVDLPSQPEDTSSQVADASSQPDEDTSSLATDVSSQSEDMPEDFPESPPIYNSLNYNSVDELIGDISGESMDEIMKTIEDTRKNEKRDGTFREFITELRSDYLYVPYYQNREIEFLDKEGFYAITLFPSELYSQPWVWYYPDRDQTDVFCICIMKLDENTKAKANKNGAPWLMKEINPHGKDSETPYPLYTKSYEKEVVLQNRTVTALVGHWENDDRGVNIHFVYDDIFVKVVVLSDKAYEWMKELSFEKVPIKG